MCINFKTMKVGFFFLMTPPPPDHAPSPLLTSRLLLDIEIKRYKKQRELIIVISLWSYFAVVVNSFN